MSKTKYIRDNEKWVVMTREEWMEELGWDSRHKYDRVIKRLEELGLVVKEKHPHPTRSSQQHCTWVKPTKPDIQTSAKPDIQKAGKPDIQTSAKPDTLLYIVKLDSEDSYSLRENDDIKQEVEVKGEGKDSKGYKNLQSKGGPISDIIAQGGRSKVSNLNKYSSSYFEQAWKELHQEHWPDKMVMSWSKAQKAFCKTLIGKIGEKRLDEQLPLVIEHWDIYREYVASNTAYTLNKTANEPDILFLLQTVESLANFKGESQSAIKCTDEEEDGEGFTKFVPGQFR